MVAEECKQIENLQHNMARIEEHVMSKINAFKQKQHTEKFAHKIIPCYGCGQIHYYKECPFKREIALIVAQKVTSICIGESQKIKRGQK